MERVRREARQSYDIEQEVRVRQVPTTVYDTIQETLYRDVPRTEYRKVPETVYDDVFVDRRIVHEHISDPDDYDPSDYKNSHEHDSDLRGAGFGLSSDFSEDLYYGDTCRDCSSSSASTYRTSLSTDRSLNSKFHSDSDHYRQRGSRRHVYAIDVSSHYFSSESSQYDYYQDSYPSRSHNSRSDQHSDAESFTQYGDGYGHTPNRYSRNVTGEVYERVVGGDSYSSDSLDESIDLHYHRYTDVEQVPRTIYHDEPYTVFDSVPYTVDRTIPREVLVNEDFLVDVKVPVTTYVDVPYTDYEERAVVTDVERVVSHKHSHGSAIDHLH